MQEKIKEDVINELTKLLIKTDFYEKQNQVDIYVKKTRIYKDLITMFKELLWWITKKKRNCKTKEQKTDVFALIAGIQSYLIDQTK